MILTFYTAVLKMTMTKSSKIFFSLFEKFLWRSVEKKNSVLENEKKNVINLKLEIWHSKRANKEKLG